MTLVLPLVMIQLFDRVIPNAAEATLTVLAAFLFGAVLIEAILRYGVAALLLREGTNFAAEAERKLMHEILHRPKTLDGNQRTSRHLEAWETIERLRSSHAAHGRHSAIDLPFAAIFIAVFWMVAPPLLPVLATILAVALLSTRLNRASLRELNAKRRDHTTRLGGFASEVFGGIEHIKGLSAEQLMIRRQESLAGHASLVTEALIARQAVSKTLVESIGQATPILIAISGAFWVNAGALTTGALAAAILLSGRAVQPVLRARDQAEARRILAPLKKELEDIIAVPPAHRGDRPMTRVGSLALENVTARTAEGSTILTDISLEIQTGECIAIMGASGSGKSTLMHLLAGALTPSEGRLLVNGEPAKVYRSRDITREIALVRQGGTILSGSIMDLITSNRGESCLPQALAVSDELGLSRFLASRSEGFDLVGHQGFGGSLPGAMAGLLPIVAALSRNPSVLIFDEANGALDQKADQLLRAALERRSKSCILVITTQRPSFASLADRRFRIEEGRLTELTDVPQLKERVS